MLNIQDQAILSTGASSGIGEVCARLLAEKGARLLCGVRCAERLEQPAYVDLSELMVRLTASPY
jgi:NADP-dependent 3-hydroxy acid dehydrogenase YdfG